MASVCAIQRVWFFWVGVHGRRETKADYIKRREYREAHALAGLQRETVAIFAFVSFFASSPVFSLWFTPSLTGNHLGTYLVYLCLGLSSHSSVCLVLGRKEL
ncbi:hypothetical protein B0T24DRAFT_314655 [Lasiosphaeria ovina]|uniref:Transmembrane protein n=1 Tax=Lasiosphaeria ovina TaxID=92902 RepID=A0AAE0K6W2_9PEZI|nr:hypothetical protein B0T24DRAFT_314655 [Lasiosphaeria ovina]